MRCRTNPPRPLYHLGSHGLEKDGPPNIPWTLGRSKFTSLVGIGSQSGIEENSSTDLGHRRSSVQGLQSHCPLLPDGGMIGGI